MLINHQTINAALANLMAIDPMPVGQRLHDLLDLDRTHPSRPDGHPPSVVGAQPSSTIAPIKNPDEADPSGTTEAAVWAATAWRDPLHRQLMDAATHLIEAAAHLQAAVNIAGRPVPGLTSDRQPGAAQLGNERRCWIMATIGHHDPVYRVTDFAGILDQALDSPRPCGRWAYRFVRETGRLPTEAEKQAHARGRYVRIARR